jgi:ABC-type glycerol-3-phosphate transport system permease component
MKNRFIFNKFLIIFLAILVLFPLYFLFVGSLYKNVKFIIMPPNLFPLDATLDNYFVVLNNLNILKWASNTIIVLVLTTIGNIFVNTMAGYAFSFYNFPFKKIIWMLLLFGIMVPRISLIIPLFMVMNKLHLSGELLAVILPCLFNPMFLYLSKIYFDSIPKSLIESARMDGANEFQVLVKIVMPISMPLITTIGLFSSIGAMQDWIWQSLQLQKNDNLTALVGMVRAMYGQAWAGQGNKNFIGQNFAIGVILILPVLIIFICASKYFTNGLQGAVKE